MNKEHQELMLENFQVEELEQRLEMNAGPIEVEAKVEVDKNGPKGTASIKWSF